MPHHAVESAPLEFGCARGVVGAGSSFFVASVSEGAIAALNNLPEIVLERNEFINIHCIGAQLLFLKYSSRAKACSRMQINVRNRHRSQHLTL